MAQSSKVDSFDKIDIEDCLDQLAMLEFFPREEGPKAAVGVLLAKICPNRTALLWLVAQMVNHVGKWHGPAELRGVLCTRFRSADGIEADSSLPGYSPADGEMRALEEHEQIKIGGTAQENRLLLKAREWPALAPGKPQ